MSAPGAIQGFYAGGIGEMLSSQLATNAEIQLVVVESIGDFVRIDGDVSVTQDYIEIRYSLTRSLGENIVASGEVKGLRNNILILQDRLATDIAGHLSNISKR